MNKQIILPSGASLDISTSSLEICENLLESVLEELKAVQLHLSSEVDIDMFKNLFCAAFSSKKVKLCLKECMKKVAYNGRKVDKDTFDPDEARGDYLLACFEVAKENLLPFMKPLAQQYSLILEKLKKDPA